MTNAKLKEVSEEDFEDRLNEIYGDIDICGFKYPAGEAMRKLDPIAFRCGLCDEPDRWGCGDCDREYETEEEAEACCAEETEEKEKGGTK